MSQFGRRISLNFFFLALPPPFFPQLSKGKISLFVFFSLYCYVIKAWSLPLPKRRQLPFLGLILQTSKLQPYPIFILLNLCPSSYLGGMNYWEFDRILSSLLNFFLSFYRLVSTYFNKFSCRTSTLIENENVSVRAKFTVSLTMFIA